MAYTIHELARISGVSTRTLRYYHQIGLLCPSGREEGGRRLYGAKETDLLQHILFYRELGLPLQQIKQIVTQPNFDRCQALQHHLDALQEQKVCLEALIATVGKTLASLKGEYKMKDIEKFEGFKRALIQQNEVEYGREIRAAYGDAAIDASNARLMGMEEAQYEKAQKLSQEIAACLRQAAEKNDPACEAAQKACALHREWLCLFWEEGAYSKQAHRALGQMYLADERFKAYYDAFAPGAAALLARALEIYCR